MTMTKQLRSLAAACCLLSRPPKGDRISNVSDDEINRCPGLCDADEPIHNLFGLDHEPYLVLHRTLLQSMPSEWQRRFANCVEELVTAASGLPQPKAYHVQAARRVYLWELNDVERKQCLDGEVTVIDEPGTPSLHHHGRFHVGDTEHDGSVLVLLPAPDPVPPYDRGRTRVELRYRRLAHPQTADGEAKDGRE